MNDSHYSPQIPHISLGVLILPTGKMVMGRGLLGDTVASKLSSFFFFFFFFFPANIFPSFTTTSQFKWGKKQPGDLTSGSKQVMQRLKTQRLPNAQPCPPHPGQARKEEKSRGCREFFTWRRGTGAGLWTPQE